MLVTRTIVEARKFEKRLTARTLGATVSAARLVAIPILLAAAGGIATPASAQIVGPVQFTTAFPFTVGHATVPAGTYTLVPDVDRPLVLQLTGKHIGVFFDVEDAKAAAPPSSTEVVFARCGDSYVLKNVWVLGNDLGVVTVPDELEKRYSKAGTVTGHERVRGEKISS